MKGRVIPCIDVMDGKVVQLVQGERKVLELDSPDEAIALFHGFPLLHVIDLDAALGRGDNRDLVADLLKRVKARVGGGVRSVEDAENLVGLGAEQVIVGSAAFAPTDVDREFLARLARAVGANRVIVAIDIKAGSIAVRGWQQTLDLRPDDVIEPLSRYCAGFLCTNVDREGMLGGTDLNLFHALRARTERTVIAAGGITTMTEVRTLVDANIDVALGMAVYTGALDLAELRELNVQP